jgi:glycosyltransferase involved in cell wall biosynthesis
LYRLRGRQVVFTAHNVNIRKRDGRDTWLNRWSLGIQYRLCAQIFVHTERMRQELLAEFAVPADKASVIPFGINSTVPDTALTGAEARTRLGLARSDKVILFFGNIAPYKGLEHLLEAFISLAREMPELRLIIAGRPKGEAEYWGRLERRIGDCGFKDRIVLRIEYVPDADTEIYFKAADVLALPYNHIFQSGVLFLGYNFGLPVLATDVGSLKDDVVEGETGFVCPPRDAQAMAGSLKKYFGSELYHELPTKRARIKDFATDRYSWAKVASISRRAYAAALC